MPDTGQLSDDAEPMHRLARLGFINVDRTKLPVRRRNRSRGVPNALLDYPVELTDDLHLATDVTSKFLGKATITPREDGSEFKFQATIHAARMLDVTMAHLDYRCPVTIEVPQSEDCFSIHMTSAGSAAVTIAGLTQEINPFFALVVSPGTDYAVDCARDSPQLVLRIEREAVERQLTRMIGRSLHKPIRFEPICDLASEAATRWYAALQIFSTELASHGSLIHRGIGAPPLEELIISTLLYLAPSNYTSQLHGAAASSGRPAVRRAMDYIEANLAEPITIADIAAAVGMSPRSVQAGFREDLQTTPIAFIRDRRLDRVRATLLEAQPGDGTTVTEVAEKWGFNHLSNFSWLYRRRFGETPSDTLRR